MKTKIVLKALVLIILLICTNVHAQFNMDAYKSFLKNNQSLTSSELIEMHNAGLFAEKININPVNALYYDSISIKYELTNYEKELISKQGFMVSERLRYQTFGHAFFDIFEKDMPVFVSTDAILHAFHRSYDRILMYVEKAYLIRKLDLLLSQMHAQIPDLAAKYSSDPRMLPMLKDVDVFVTIPLRLLGKNTQPYFAENNNTVSELLDLIFKEQPQDYYLFSENCRTIDFSQFKPRGHYNTEYEHEAILKNYFRAMIWLGRTELYLIGAKSFPTSMCKEQTFSDIQRQVIDAFLISELIEKSNSSGIYNGIEDILKFFVGDPDNVTISNLSILKNAVSLSDPAELLDSIKVVEFQDTLKNQSFAGQMILSQILYSDPFSPDQIVPASAFLLFGQRFVIDSYVTGNVVYDKILFNNQKICRLFPSALDPMFALGNDAAAQLLTKELNAYLYSDNLAALRYLIDSYSPEFWKETVYNSWLQTIRTLNPPKDRSSLPLFMHTAAFWQEKLNTQLASWAQLRHDNILYAKQSYTGGTLCSYPYVYVEPIPEFYKCLNTLAITVLNKFENLDLTPDYMKNSIIEYFQNLASTTDTLYNVAEKELNNITLSSNEESFLKKLIYKNEHGSGTPPYGGWYAKLFFDDQSGYDGLLREDYIVADIHTTPTDCSGGKIGAVVHVGTGPINLGVFVAEAPGNKIITYIGPLLSYYEHTTTNFKRLTDQEWETIYNVSPSFRPDWVNAYLADKDGNSKGEGAMLLTSIKQDEENTPLNNSYIIAQNYPNPFNPSTIIRFVIPDEISGAQVRLNVYNIQGELVKSLLNENLSSGNYLTKWDGTDNNGNAVTSGAYFYYIVAGGKRTTGKMTLIK